MGYPTKVATCCYCGTRAALVLKGRERHELACTSCGAPLHDLKMLPKARKGDRELVRPLKPTVAKKKPKKTKKRKSLFKTVFEEAFDVIEDIFD